MALVKCAECGEEISKDSVTCPNCGHPIESPEEKEPTQEKEEPTPTPGIVGSKRNAYILAAILIIILILIIIY